jgi:hypothetical protein
MHSGLHSAALQRGQIGREVKLTEAALIVGPLATFCVGKRPENHRAFSASFPQKCAPEWFKKQQYYGTQQN